MNNITNELSQSIATSFINFKLESKDEYRPKLLVNNYKKGSKVINYLIKELEKCEEFYFSIAFITNSGLNILLNILKELENKGIKGKIITTNYLNFNEPKALRQLLDFKNIEVKVFDSGNFHAKGYIFKHKELYTMIIGSSNLTQEALTKNEEWNLKVSSLVDGELLIDTLNEYNDIWEKSSILNNDWINEYEKHYKKIVQYEIIDYSKIIETFDIKPNLMQTEALQGLKELRENNETKGLLISATGTGKTYLSAFDVRDVKPKRLLFLVHREQILKQASETFKNVLGDSINLGFLSGTSKDYKADYLFSTIQMISKDEVMKQFNPEHFDYIIIDETHRAEATSYKKICTYFKAKFTLGMTATPERSNGINIYHIFDHNIAYEIRLQQAMEEDMLCPFHYFGVSELSIDGIEVEDKTDFKYLTSNVRVDNIIEKINFYGYSGDRVKGLIFCSCKDEARELSKIFNERGFHTKALLGDDNQNIRETTIELLEQKSRIDGLDYIFTVDIFNEGIDIPSINQVVMLRPTKSSIIFIQQLGRGLRKFGGKEFVVVIDFIGNYDNNFLIPIALSGDRSFNKDNIRKYVAEGNKVIPGCSTINFDEVSKKRIYKAIDKVRLNVKNLIKEEYFNLKFKLGRIPELEEFEKFGSIEVIKIFNKFGSYHAFLKENEKDEYSKLLDDREEKIISFLSQKIAKAKRIHELVMLKCLIYNKNSIKKVFKNLLKEDYDIDLTDIVEQSVINNLTNKFPKDADQKIYLDCVFLQKEGNDYTIDSKFAKSLKNKDFYEMILKIIQYGIKRYEDIYLKRYKDTNFVLYQKYTYEDVCRLMNFEKNIVALNIGGYFYDKTTRTMPVFINYIKAEGSQAYEDRFISSSNLIALSKHPRKITSNDAKHIYNSREEGNKIYLFVRKSKDDEESKEFYFLGEIYAVGKPNAMKMIDTNDDVFEINYHLETSVREDVYDYLIT